MVIVTPNIPNNTIFAMSQTTELYYLLCSFQNIVPFIIATIKNGWLAQEPIEATEKSHKELYGFESRNYDFDTLEKELVNRF